ncbi:MAG: hypothetical protein ISS48_00115 [Candidatus Aenigmarchaeota archaeon]|nr:hypothetical protein [Candidatus Aenigmarchaeota archaeon]
MEKRWEKILIGILIIFLASKYGIIINLLSGSPLFSKIEIELISIPWGIRAIFWIIGLWFIFGRIIGYLAIINGAIVIAISIPVGFVTLGIGFGLAVPGIVSIILGIMMLKSS